MPETRAVGQRVRRIDSPPKLTGQERFTGDLRPAGLLFARPVGSAYAVWTGIGAIGTVVLGIVLFDESRAAARLLFVHANTVRYRLRQLRPGDTVEVERADGTRLVFVVEQARSYPKAGFPTAAVFGPVPSAALRLITCTGAFDRARGSYRDNLVVFARLAGAAG